MAHAWVKAAQRQLYSLVSSPRWLAAAVLAALTLIIVIFQFAEVTMEWSKAKYEERFHSFADNIGQTSYQERLCSPLPMDVVYTWVNGSDPRLLADLAKVKLDYERRRNMTEQAAATQAELERLEREVAAANSSTSTSSLLASNGTRLANGTVMEQGAGAGLDGLLDSALVFEADSADNASRAELLAELALLPASATGRHVYRDDRSLAFSVVRRTQDCSYSPNFEDGLRTTLDETCGSVREIVADDSQQAGLVVFRSAADARRCLQQGHANISFSSVSFVSNMSLAGLVSMHPDLGFDSEFGFSSHTHRTAMLADVPSDLSGVRLRRILEGFGNLTYFRLLRDKNMAVVTFSQRFGLIQLSQPPFLQLERQSLQSPWYSVAAAEPLATYRAGADDAPANETALSVMTTSDPMLTRALPVLPTVRIGALPLLAARDVRMLRACTARVERQRREAAAGETGDGHAAGDEDEDEHDHEPDEMSTSRFQDNSELQYSLRAIERNAPWVRHIYIVTNGQIPSWLNLDHPRLTLVTHEDIFANTSHLPTFSSPSIEAHLHRIPGLSKKFLYLNDDVLFGMPVWPDDFYTHAKGQKVYLAWPVPNCDEGCPSNWIADGYCDMACNNSACDFDGGDCLNKPANAYESWQASDDGYKPPSYCNVGCADTWLSDKYCDKSCNVADCAYDMGDCGFEVVREQLPQFVLGPNTTHLRQDELASHPRGLWINMTLLVGNASISDGQFDDNGPIAAAVISQRHQALMLVLKPDVNRTTTSVAVVYANTTAGSRGGDIRHTFNLTIDTSAPLAAGGDGAEGVGDEADGFLNVPDGEDEPGHLRGRTKLANHTDSDIINPWAMGGLHPTSRLTTLYPPTTPRPKSPHVRLPELPANLTLPLAVAARLAELEAEFEQGELTAKGLAKYKLRVLQPVLDGVWVGDAEEEEEAGEGEEAAAVLGEEEARRRRRRLLRLVGDGRTAARAEEEGEETPAPLEPFASGPDAAGNTVTINGLHVSRAQLEFSDWVANQKAKQLSFKADMARAIRTWEERTGKTWHNDAVPDDRLSSLPWERRATFKYLVEDSAGFGARHRSSVWRSRTLKDTFGESLKHTNSLYNKAFGYAARKVIAHMPHLIDRDIMTELVDAFPEEWDVTSANKLRSPNDMQYAFAFMHFVINAPAEFSAQEEFREIDVDRNGILSVNELRTLVTRLYDLPVSTNNWHEFEDILLNCSSLQPPLEILGVGVGPSAYEVWVTEQLFTQCEPLLALVRKMVGKQYKYKHELEPDESEIAFKMVRNNATEVAAQLDPIRKEPKKFICLNDNIDHRKPSAREVVNVLQDFYQSMFPLRSEFELPPGYRNRFLHVRELREWKHRHALVMWWTRLLALAMAVAVAYLVATGRFQLWRRRWLQWRSRRRTVVAGGGGGSSSSRTVSPRRSSREHDPEGLPLHSHRSV